MMQSSIAANLLFALFIFIFIYLPFLPLS